jgi:hypothetical protein
MPTVQIAECNFSVDRLLRPFFLALIFVGLKTEAPKMVYVGC